MGTMTMHDMSVITLRDEATIAATYAEADMFLFFPFEPGKTIYCKLSSREPE